MPSHLTPMLRSEFKKDVLLDNQRAHNLTNRELCRIRNREKQDLEQQLSKKYVGASEKFNIMLSLVPKDVLSEQIKHQLSSTRETVTQRTVRTRVHYKHEELTKERC